MLSAGAPAFLFDPIHSASGAASFQSVGLVLPSGILRLELAASGRDQSTECPAAGRPQLPWPPAGGNAMRVALIHPRLVEGYQTPAVMEPLALAILAALTPKTHTIRAIDE